MTLPPRRHSATKCGPGCPSTWSGEFAEIGPGGGPADESGYDLRIEWERTLGRDRWVGLSWPKEYGGRDAGIVEQVIFNEEYAKAGAPARISFFGEGLFAPTLIAYGTEEQKQRFLPKIQAVDELWCQGYSEPNAGSDLSNVQTRAVLDGDEWVDQRPEGVDDARAPRGLVLLHLPHRSRRAGAQGARPYLLIPMDQPGVTVAADPPDDGHGRVQRGLLRRRPHRSIDGARRGQRRLEGRDGDARLRARHRLPRPAARVPAGAERARRRSRTRTVRRARPRSVSASRRRTSGSRS